MDPKINIIFDNTTSAKILNDEVYQGNGPTSASAADLVSHLSDDTLKQADPESPGKNDKPRSGRCNGE